MAPVLIKGATSRNVYLPPLAKGTVWRNVFTGVEIDTSAGGKNITEATPLDTFPLYKKHVTLAYPPAPPPPPAPVPFSCSSSTAADKCTVFPDTDAAPGAATEGKHFNSSSAADCCTSCKADSTCEYFVWGPFNYSCGTPTCFFLSFKHLSQRTMNNRTLGCA